MQSMPITTKVVSLNPSHDEVYSIQHDVMNIVSDLRQVSGFLLQLNWLPRYNWNIVESGIKYLNPSLHHHSMQVKAGFDLELFKLQMKCNGIHMLLCTHA